MSNARYSLPEKTENIKTGKLLYISSAVYAEDWKSFQHIHYFLEIFYVVKGQGEFSVDGNNFSVSAGDIVIVNPQIRHTETSNPINPLEYVVLGIEGLCFDFGDENENYRVLHINEEYYKDLKQILIEMQEGAPYYAQLCQSLMDVFLLKLMRCSEYSFSVVPLKRITNECAIAKRYIDAHFSEDISLDFLAELVHLNKYYIAHSFAEAYGISVISYLLGLRLRCAQEHLADSDLTIAQIAQVSGFSSHSYFTQMFKRSLGVSPVTYRKRLLSGNAF